MLRFSTTSRPVLALALGALSACAAANTSSSAPANVASARGRADTAWIVTPTGLRYATLTRGRGDSARQGQRATIHETTSLTNGTVIYTSRGASPITFLLGGKQVIDGVDQGVTGMRIGERRLLEVPTSLSQRAGYPPNTPRDSTLRIDIELVGLQTLTGNPILPGWYADPEAHVFNGQYWIFPTYSAVYNQQTFLDAFSSNDLVTWTRHEHILDTASVKWARRAVWAPSIVEKDGWYYLFFGANDIQNDQEKGGIGVARARTPAGPFVDYLGKPLIDRFHNGAQPIDQMVFRDDDGSYYIVYGGWRHCNIAKLNRDFTGFEPFPDGSIFREITPKGYVEGAYMMRKDGKYYFMWSEGGWTGPDYAVAYAVGTSPFGPFERVGQILAQDSTVATGAGHHSVLHAPGSPNWYIVYHRRPLGRKDRNERVVSIDKLQFEADGRIKPVKITHSGVAQDRLRR